MDTIQKYRKKPIEIEAIRLTEANMDEVKSWLVDNDYQHFLLSVGHLNFGKKFIEATAFIGDYVIKRPDGTFVVNKRAEFKDKYDLLETQSLADGPGGGFVTEVPIELEETIEKPYLGDNNGN